MTNAEYLFTPYDEILEKILWQGRTCTNKRTGQKTRALFGAQCRYRLDDRFPLMTRRKTWPKAIFAELLWMLSGSTNNKDLQALGSNIWTPWVSKDFEEQHGYAEGCLGPIYGFQMRHFGGYYGDGAGGMSAAEKSLYDTAGLEDESGYQQVYGYGGVDQLADLLANIRQDPSSRRLLFSLWNPRQLGEQRLPPCHYSYQVCIDDAGKMSAILQQRSADWPIGVCGNVQFYSALTCMLAQQTGYQAWELIHSVGNAHIYENQFAGVKEYLTRPLIPSPYLKLKKAKDLFSYSLDDFVLEEYHPGEAIKIPVAI